MEKEYKFHVKGMHCKSCVLVTEDALKESPMVRDVVASLDKHQVKFSGDFGEKSEEEVMTELSPLLEKHGYSLTKEIEIKKANWGEFKIAIPIAVAFIAFYIFLQKIGLVNLVTADKVSYGTAFFIGIIASLSTCMAVVGGLVLSISAAFAKEGDKFGPQALFHVGRILAFIILGGAIGALGSAFQLNSFGTFILSLVVAFVMLALGINLLDVFPWAKKLQISLPKVFAKQAHNTKNLKHTLAPFLVGVATFFLPCGFTQSMQIYTLSTGDFWSGAMTMFFFALGTLPVLALLSFSSFSIGKSLNAGIFFKTAGLIVIIFALFNLINALVVVNVLPPVFNF